MSVPALKYLDKQIEEIKKTEINAVVIDMKDDFGNIYFTASSRTASDIKAQKNPVDIKSILKKLKDNNIYAIARIVTFKDQKMFSAFNGRYTIKNKNTGKPWHGAEAEYWVDAYSEFVQDYKTSALPLISKTWVLTRSNLIITLPSTGPLIFVILCIKKILILINQKF